MAEADVNYPKKMLFKSRLSKDRIENTHGENTALKILTTNQNRL
jgi:hypothetical protein